MSITASLKIGRRLQRRDEVARRACRKGYATWQRDSRQGTYRVYEMNRQEMRMMTRRGNKKYRCMNAMDGEPEQPRPPQLALCLVAPSMGVLQEVA